MAVYGYEGLCRATYGCVCGYVWVCMAMYQGHPTRKSREKGLECSFPLSRIVLWPFKGIFLRANTI